MNQVSYDTKRNKEYLGGKKKKMIKQKIVFVLVVAIVFLAMAGGVEAAQGIIGTVNAVTDGTRVDDNAASMYYTGTEVNSRSDTMVTFLEGASGPLIIFYTISQSTITPPQTTKIDVTFSEKVSYKIAIENATGTIIYDWTGKAKNPDAKIWDGTYESDGTVVPTGNYTVNVTGTSTLTKRSVTDTTKVITVTTDEGAPTIVSYTISNSTIVPLQTTAIDVEFSENVSYTIAIENATGIIIYDWTGNAKDPQAKIWDGTYESDGSDVPAGDYSVNVTGTNTTTNKRVTDTSKVITVSTGEAPTIVSYLISNSTITPPQTTGIDVAFSEKVSYKIAIENATGTIMYDWTGNAKDPQAKIWDGTYESDGTVVPAGVYTVNVTGAATGGFVINNTEIITVAQGGEVYDVKLSVNTHEQVVAPNNTATYMLTVKNIGTVTDNYTLNVTNENGATVALNKAAIANLGVGASENVLLNVSSATVGTFVVNVTATSENGGTGVNSTITTTTTVQNVTLSIVSYTISNYTITPPQITLIDVAFSEKVSYKIAIENTTGTVMYDWVGNAKDPQAKEWNGTYESDGTVVPAGDYTVNVTGTNTTTGAYVMNNTEIITVTSAETLKIIDYAPGTPVYDYAAATRTFNVTVNKQVNVSWQINGTEVQRNETVTEATYTNQSAVNGTWTVSAVVSNANGTAIQTWLWHVGKNQPPIVSFSYSPANPVINQTVTLNASDSKDHDGNITNYEWGFGDSGNTTNTTMPITNHTYASAGTFTVTLTVTDDEGATNATSQVITVSGGLVFDTGTGTYPSIAGTHNGTITTNVTIEVSKLYTYPCAGTGGHTEHVIIWNESGVIIAEANWAGYQVDGHTITFDNSFTLVENATYNYTIRTGSYPQIIHADSKAVAGGTITCASFVDTNGNTYTDWIPAIRLGN
ncbi:PKD repeat-containing protein [Candidatus Methanophagaceae archaeon]|nr:PKD repeat-containing protein [Methanophagales archaeon]